MVKCNIKISDRHVGNVYGELNRIGALIEKAETEPNTNRASEVVTVIADLPASKVDYFTQWLLETDIENGAIETYT